MSESKKQRIVCPDCEGPGNFQLDRRDFLKNVAGGTAAAAAAAGVPVWAVPKASAAPAPIRAAETEVKLLYETLSEEQKKVMCFAWDHVDPRRGLLRSHVSNNWHITRPAIRSDFYTKEQQDLAHQIFKSTFNPEWYSKLLKQLKEDTAGQPWGTAQNIAIFGKPGEGEFEFVLTGRHITMRVDGNSEAHVPWGGPIFHGHAASGFNEQVGHPGNVFWHQAVMANQVYQMLDGKQQKQALVAQRPKESNVAFRGAEEEFPGIPVSELAGDQKELLQKVLDSLIEPYRPVDQQEVMACLEAQGGLDACHLTFYQDGDLGDDREWDNWRLEGPSFVWYFRGEPHVHIWIHVADDPSVELNARR